MSSPTKPRVLELHGRIARTYRVRDVAEVDAALRELARYFARRVAIGRLTLELIQRVRADQDLLLDARASFTKEGRL